MYNILQIEYIIQLYNSPKKFLSFFDLSFKKSQVLKSFVNQCLVEATSKLFYWRLSCLSHSAYPIKDLLKLLIAVFIFYLNSREVTDAHMRKQCHVIRCFLPGVWVLKCSSRYLVKRSLKIQHWLNWLWPFNTL